MTAPGSKPAAKPAAPAAKPAATVPASANGAKPPAAPAIIEFVDAGFTTTTLAMTLVGGIIAGALVVWAINRFVVIEDDHHA